jgi:hypothetical protein
MKSTCDTRRTHTSVRMEDRASMPLPGRFFFFEGRFVVASVVVRGDVVAPTPTAPAAESDGGVAVEREGPAVEPDEPSVTSEGNEALVSVSIPPRAPAALTNVALDVPASPAGTSSF